MAQSKKSQPKQLLDDIAKRDVRMKSVTTKETNPLPTRADIEKEKTETELRKSIGQFDKKQLKPQQVEEKNPLPSPDDIQGEKREKERNEAIASFNRRSLKNAKTDVKNTLPTKEDIQKEKAAQK